MNPRSDSTLDGPSTPGVLFIHCPGALRLVSTAPGAQPKTAHATVNRSRPTIQGKGPNDMYPTTPMPPAPPMAYPPAPAPAQYAPPAPAYPPAPAAPGYAPVPTQPAPAQ